MEPEFIASLISKQILTPLDVHFARLLMKLAGKDSKDLFLAAALASHSRGEGHICFDVASKAGRRIQEDDPDSVFCPQKEDWLKSLAREEVVGKPGDFRPLILDGPRVYLYRYWEYERRLIEFLTERSAGVPEQIDEEALKKGLSRLFPLGEKGEADWQKVAAFASVWKRLCVISGGPGTGKTFTVAKILALLLEQNITLRIALSAPTGKAAARLEESIKTALQGLNCSHAVKAGIPVEASTIHRLLKSMPDSPYFRFNAENRLPFDVVVVDEASMVDLALMSKLAQAVGRDSRMILLGDRDQLASVEAGAVLGDICDTGKPHGFSEIFSERYRRLTGEAVPGERDIRQPDLRDSIVHLKKSWRFGPDSGMGTLSRLVNEGDGPGALLQLKNGSLGDVHWEELPRPESLPLALKGWVLHGLAPYLKETDPAKSLDLFNRLRILCAVREGPYGIYHLNLMIERILREERLIAQNTRWYAGRPVLVTRNDYHLNLFNGDVGITLADPASNGGLRVFFPGTDGGMRKFPPLRIPEHEAAYAMTVHKSQGSEFDRVLFLMPDRSLPVLTRELVYTAITRAREKVEIWGREGVLLETLGRRIERTSGLREALWG